MTTTIRNLAAMAADAQARLQRLTSNERSVRLGEMLPFPPGPAAVVRAIERDRLHIAAEHFAALPAANDAAMPALEPA